jgi:hypothetical protein
MYDVINAKYIEDYKLEIEFSDNSKGVIDFSDYLKRPGLYQNLNDINFFKNFIVDNTLNTLTWKNGLDIAPDTLYFKVTDKYPLGLEVL